jgi:branched-chain amino acid transport system ATP-binding protein
MEALAAVGLEGKAPLAAHTLPFGDLRRMEIARALATHPDVLLLDEPFSGLSASEVGPLTALLGVLSQQGMTMLIVEHKLRELMRLVKRVVVLHFGEIISEGPPEEIARDPSVVEAYLGGKAWDDPIGGPG